MICTNSCGELPTDPIRDYRVTRVTFGVSASSFVANMYIKQNAANLVKEFPLVAAAVEESFYVDDGLTGADNVETAVRLQKKLQQLFATGGFLLHKWNSKLLNCSTAHTTRIERCTRGSSN